MNKKKHIILISGEANTGKTNTMASIYRKMFKLQREHIFIRYVENKKNTNELEIKEGSVEIQDFIAVFKLRNGKIIVLISKGDVCNEFIDDWLYVKKFEADLLVVTERISPRTHPIYDYIHNQLQDEADIKLHINTLLHGIDYIHNAELLCEMEETISDAVLGYISKI